MTWSGSMAVGASLATPFLFFRPEPPRVRLSWITWSAAPAMALRSASAVTLTDVQTFKTASKHSKASVVSGVSFERTKAQ